MRLVSAQASGDSVVRARGSVRVGSAPDDDVPVRGAGVAPHHVAITADARGLTLTVTTACPRVYVNARIVRERAILHHGDTLVLGGNKLLLTSDDLPPVPEGGAADRAEPGLALLRIISGTASGKALPVQPEVRLGQGGDHFGELAYACRVYWSAAALVLEADAAGPRVNGWPCERARLGPGDQIVLDSHRLLVEAPGLEYAQHQAALPPVAAPARVEPVRERPVRAEIGWLLLAAAILAAIIALILYFHG